MACRNCSLYLYRIVGSTRLTAPCLKGFQNCATCSNIHECADRVLLLRVLELPGRKLGGNLLTVIRSGGFIGLSSLQSLDLRTNYPLTLIESGAFPEHLLTGCEINSDYADLRSCIKSYGNVTLVLDPQSDCKPLRSSYGDLWLGIGAAVGGIGLLLCVVCRSRRKSTPVPKEADHRIAIAWLMRLRHPEFFTKPPNARKPAESLSC
eukprot:m.818304 g.818304  ORF g.818304 m.818304 type:complete len:207 (+) comp59388_c0_seq91:1236-1856(+)